MINLKNYCEIIIFGYICPPAEAWKFSIDSLDDWKFIHAMLLDFTFLEAVPSGVVRQDHVQDRIGFR